MMFKGSENVGPGEHFYTIFSNGGTMNGTTNKERTLYFETMPANQLEAAMFLEADRMRSLAIVKENLDNQRKAVQEERRQGLDNQPYGRTNEAIDELAFDNPAYKHSVIGSMDDLNAASVAGCRLVLPDLLRAEQRHRRGGRRRDDGRRAGAGAHVLRVHPGSAGASRRRHQPGAATGERRLRSTIRWRGFRASTSATASPSSLAPDDDAVDLLSLVLSADGARASTKASCGRSSSR